MKSRLLIVAMLLFLHAECQIFDASSIKMCWKDSKGIPYMTLDGKVYFACMEASMGEFAEHFLNQGCQSALYLESDHPDIWYNGNSRNKFNRFGPMIVAEKSRGK